MYVCVVVLSAVGSLWARLLCGGQGEAERDFGFLTELPMELFGDVDIPGACSHRRFRVHRIRVTVCVRFGASSSASWYGEFSEMSDGDQVSLMQRGWLSCTAADQRMVLGDMEHYYGVRL